jgi:hypothetical protein
VGERSSEWSADAARGRIPFRLRIGVTGHRDAADDPALQARVDDAIERIGRAAPSSVLTPLLFEVVSPISEGADRLVAERVLEVPGATLEAPLPMDEAEYLKDFRSEDARREFLSLLARSEASPVMPWALRRPFAYSEVGEYVVDTSDVLVAVWNGQPAHGPGGTADVVQRAVRAGMPRVIISTSAPYEVQARDLDRDWGLFRGLDRFNRAELPPGRSSVRLGRPRHTGGDGASVSAVGDAVADVERWIDPYFARADGLAVRYQRRFILVGRSLSLFAALAVATVATQSIFFPGRDRLAWIEVALMLAVLLLWLRTKGSVHASWISYRFFAERLRAAAYLALLGSETFPGETPTGVHHGNPTQEWLTRAFREVWRLRPAWRPGRADARALASMLRSSWVDPQVEYYEQRGIYHRRVHRVQLVTSVVLFTATGLAATLHSVGMGEGSAVGKWLVFGSIVLPVLGGAVSWVGALEEHRRLGERFGSMVRRLRTLGEWLDRIDELPSLRELANLIDAELRTEAGEWIDVMRYNDVELPS